MLHKAMSQDASQNKTALDNKDKRKQQLIMS